MGNEELYSLLGIKKATLYTWLKATGCKSSKDASGKAFYDPETIATLEQFRDYLKAGGKMDEWKGGELVTTKPEEINLDTQEINLDSEDPRLAQLLDNAHRQAAGVLIAQNILAGKFIENPDSLPPEYKQMVDQYAPAPKSIDPLDLAKNLVQKLAIEGGAA